MTDTYHTEVYLRFKKLFVRFKLLDQLKSNYGLVLN